MKIKGKYEKHEFVKETCIKLKDKGFITLL